MSKRLYRDIDNRVVAGVCAGFGQYFALDPSLIRVAAVLLAIIQFPFVIILYVLAAIIMPPQPGMIGDGGGATGISRRTMGWVLVVVGAVLLFMNVVWPQLRLLYPVLTNIRQLWPLLIVAAGLALMNGSRKRG